MIRKKWNGDELVLSVETEDEFWKAVSTGEAVELTRELGDQKVSENIRCPAYGKVSYPG